MAKQTQGKADQAFFMECPLNLRPDKHYGRFVHAASTLIGEALQKGPYKRALEQAVGDEDPLFDQEVTTLGDKLRLTALAM